MARERRKTTSSETGEESLVPMIEEEERRLELMLVQARADAERLVQDAERSAGERIAAARRRVPSLREERRASAVADFQKEADSLRGGASQVESELLATVESGRQAATAQIVAYVWPVDR